MKIRVEDQVLKDLDRKVEQLEKKNLEKDKEISNLQEYISELETIIQDDRTTRNIPDLSTLLPYLALLNQKAIQSDQEIQQLLRNLVKPILLSLQPEGRTEE